MENTLFPINRLDRVVQAKKRNASNLCVHPDGSTAFVFDSENQSFELINLGTGQRSPIKTEINDDQLTKPGVYWLDFIIVERSSQMYILAITLECFIVSFSYDGEMIYKTHLTCFPYNRRIYNHEGIWALFFEDNNKQLYFLMFDESPDYSAEYYAARIDVDDDGKASMVALTAESPLQGGWQLPFIISDRMYWLSKRPKGIKLFSFPLLDEKNTETLICNASKHAFTDIILRQPFVISENVFLYGFNRKKEVGFLFVLLWKEKLWRKISMFFDDCHSLDIYQPMSCKKAASSAKNFIILHGQCSSPGCGAHTYVFDISACGENEKVHSFCPKDTK